MLRLKRPRVRARASRPRNRAEKSSRRARRACRCPRREIHEHADGAHISRYSRAAPSTVSISAAEAVLLLQSARTAPGTRRNSAATRAASLFSGLALARLRQRSLTPASARPRSDRPRARRRARGLFDAAQTARDAPPNSTLRARGRRRLRASRAPPATAIRSIAPPASNRRRSIGVRITGGHPPGMPCVRALTSATSVPSRRKTTTRSCADALRATSCLGRRARRPCAGS